jgi:hypothetical protein
MSMKGRRNWWVSLNFDSLCDGPQAPLSGDLGAPFARKFKLTPASCEFPVAARVVRREGLYYDTALR